MIRWPWRQLTAAAVLCAGGLLGSVRLNTAQAAIALCRTDPIITLSDGSVGTLSEAIQDAVSDVQGVSYQLHIPVGLKVVSVQYIGDVPAAQQHLTWVADTKKMQFDEYLTVTTGATSMPMTASMTAGGRISVQQSGGTNQQLHLQLDPSQLLSSLAPNP